MSCDSALPPEADANQARASDPGASAWVSASAGTGKTAVLVKRVLRLLLEGFAPESILCLTYTKTAAAEMQNRLLEALAAWATDESGKLAKKLEKLTRRLPDDSTEGKGLLEANERLQQGLGMQRGVSHTEFIRADDGGFVFLETSARVGGAFIVDTIEAATGVNLWREWARIDATPEGTEYAIPVPRRDYAGIVLTLARQEWPDMSGYADPEVVTTIRKPHHAAGYTPTGARLGAGSGITSPAPRGSPSRGRSTARS